MKRWIGILILALLLTGCGAQTPAPSTAPSAPSTTGVPSPSETTAPSVATGEPDAALPSEPQSTVDDSATLNSMASEGCAVAAMGNNLLVFHQDSLSLWNFGSNAPITTAEIPGLPMPGSGMVQIGRESVVYFDADDCTVVFLNEELQKTRSLQVGETVLGSAYLTSDCSKLYFCTTAGIRVLELETGICRNLKLQEDNWLGITGTLMGETALRCQLRQADGSIRTLLISSENGQTLWEGDELNAITGSGQLYCYDAGSEWIFGLVGQQPQLLQADDPIALPQISAAVTLTLTEANLTLDLYDLASGRRNASLELSGTTGITGLTAFQGYLWFFADGQLYRWDPSLSPTLDEAIYTAYRYTSNNPDIEGLAIFQARANDLKNHYGIEILIWNDAALAEPAGYTFEIEYRTDAYEAGFAALEAALAQFPDTLPNRAADWTADGTLRIVLVHSITTPSETVYSTLSGMEYLLDGKVYIVLELGENLERSFYHALFHVIDPLVLSNSIAYYQWNDLNPSKFQYDNDYITNLDRDGSKYLDAGNRYFIDTYSMSYAVEDRARIFEYAILPGNESYFESKHMQAKLQMLCDGLRDVFRLEAESYIWEQYLT